LTETLTPSAAGGALTPGPAGHPHVVNTRTADFNDRYLEVLATLRAEAPVAPTPRPNEYYVSRYDDVYQVLRDHETFSSREGVAVDPGGKLLPPIDTDPPEHTAWRGLLNRWFTRGRMAAHEPAIRAAAHAMIDDALARSEVDLVTAYAGALPTEVFFTQIMGLSVAQARTCAEYVDQAVFSDDEERSKAGYAALAAFIAPLVTELRARPREDELLSEIAHAEIDGEPVSAEKAILAVTLLVLGGLETTASVLSGGLHHLALHPELLDTLRRGETAPMPFVEECLRVFAPSTGLRRSVTRPVDLGGVHLTTGDTLLVSYASANYDETAFPDAAVFDPVRAPNRHVAFGVGIHRCLGSNLARLVLTTGFTVMAERIREIELVGEVTYHSVPTRGLVTFPVRLHPHRA
jgi:cytochrome P450